ncbi:hypothetical protein P8452_26495 [Trifolium repens]|nr:hypothetical protein P8452_26495 [Trifolium repens]
MNATDIIGAFFPGFTSSCIHIMSLHSWPCFYPFLGCASPYLKQLVCKLHLILELQLTAQSLWLVHHRAGDFEEAVEEDAKTAVQDGTVHPLTNYVIREC